MRNPVARPGAVVALAIAVVAVISFLVAVAPWGNGGTEATPSRSVLLIVPFTNLTGDPDGGYLADGFTEDLIATLAGAAPSGLTVIARTSAMSFQSDTRRVQQIATSIGATHVVEGSLGGEGGTTLVDIRVLDGPTGAPFWTGSYEGGEAVDRRLLRDVVAGIGSALELHFSVDSEVAPEPGAAARNAFLHGRHFLNRQSIADSRTALFYFEAAVLAQPDYPDALAAIGEANFRLGQARLAREAATAALAIDSTHGEANRVLGNILLYDDWDFAEALRRYGTAIQGRPAPLIRHSYAFLLAYVGRGGEAIAQLEAALLEDPLSVPLLGDFGLIANMNSEHRIAVEHCARALELSPRQLTALGCMTNAYLGLAKPDSAMIYARQAWLAQGREESLLGPRDSDPTEQLRRWRELELQLLEARSQGSMAGVRRARLYIALGDTTSAVQLLQGAVFTRQPEALWIGIDPAFDGLRGTPFFEGLLERIGFPE